MKSVLWRPSALQDVEDIYTYLVERSPQGAKNVVRQIERDAQRGCLFPYSNRKGFTPNSYEIVMTQYPYIIVYEVREQIEIVAVFATATDVQRGGS